jgi:hypothetical protein
VKKMPALIITLSVLLIAAGGLFAYQKYSSQPPSIDLSIVDVTQTQPPLETQSPVEPSIGTEPLYTASVLAETNALVFSPVKTGLPVTGIALEVTVTPALSAEPSSTGIFELNDVMKSQNWTIAVNKQVTDLINNQTTLSFAALNMSPNDSMLSSDMVLKVVATGELAEEMPIEYRILQSSVELTNKNNEDSLTGVVIVENENK